MEIPINTTTLPQPRVFHYAGFWKRLLAHILDQIIMSIVAFFIVVPFLAMVGISLWSNDFEPSTDFLMTAISAYFMMILLILVGEWLYFALMESMKGGTLGKMALGIIVTDLNGNKISFGRASGRYFAKIVSSLTIGIGYIMAGITAQKQALHDMIASCLVINK
jgi:uncharacterized RDD family membrane protein YckC